jgi:adenine phosphoribosyltransferase
MERQSEMQIKSMIRSIPDYPKKGIMFRDITTLIKDPIGFRMVIDSLTQRYIKEQPDFDIIAGIESRGFIIGGALSFSLGKGFIPIRKKGKLPAEVISYEYKLEYGTDTIEIHKDAIKKGDKVLIVDDLCATGGTAIAAAALVEKLGGIVSEISFIIDLPDLKGSEKIKNMGYNVFSLTDFEGE